ncbi:hypothetical protein BDN71DRAFT_1459207 [Pleurotus eryngii]|uniref:Uncharacterized protein n=1 Tax=Pleurotus eryngii TaxID=5323 RepID=A0A9P5ZFS5_PLEER|nr:hypothetical protein BDN71DRAFT_1459207 [Pleurotus eryngii]
MFRSTISTFGRAIEPFLGFACRRGFLRLPDSLSSSSSLGSGNSSPSSLEGSRRRRGLLGPATGRPPSPASSVSEPTIDFNLAVARFFGATILRTVVSSVAFPLPFSIHHLIASSNVSILGRMSVSNSSFLMIFISSSSTVGDRRSPLGFNCTPPCSRTTFLPS